MHIEKSIENLVNIGLVATSDAGNTGDRGHVEAVP